MNPDQHNNPMWQPWFAAQPQGQQARFMPPGAMMSNQPPLPQAQNSQLPRTHADVTRPAVNPRVPPQMHPEFSPHYAMGSSQMMMAVQQMVQMQIDSIFRSSTSGSSSPFPSSTMSPDHPPSTASTPNSGSSSNNGEPHSFVNQQDKTRPKPVKMPATSSVKSPQQPSDQQNFSIFKIPPNHGNNGNSSHQNFTRMPPPYPIEQTGTNHANLGQVNPRNVSQVTGTYLNKPARPPGSATESSELQISNVVSMAPPFRDSHVSLEQNVPEHTQSGHANITPDSYHTVPGLGFMPKQQRPGNPIYGSQPFPHESSQSHNSVRHFPTDTGLPFIKQELTSGNFQPSSQHGQHAGGRTIQEMSRYLHEKQQSAHNLQYGLHKQKNQWACHCGKCEMCLFKMKHSKKDSPIKDGLVVGQAGTVSPHSVGHFQVKKESVCKCGVCSICKSATAGQSPGLLKDPSCSCGQCASCLFLAGYCYKQTMENLAKTVQMKGETQHELSKYLNCVLCGVKVESLSMLMTHIASHGQKKPDGPWPGLESSSVPPSTSEQHGETKKKKSIDVKDQPRDPKLTKPNSIDVITIDDSDEEEQDIVSNGDGGQDVSLTSSCAICGLEYDSSNAFLNHLRDHAMEIIPFINSGKATPKDLAIARQLEKAMEEEAKKEVALKSGNGRNKVGRGRPRKGQSPEQSRTETKSSAKKPEPPKKKEQTVRKKPGPKPQKKSPENKPKPPGKEVASNTNLRGRRLGWTAKGKEEATSSKAKPGPKKSSPAKSSIGSRVRTDDIKRKARDQSSMLDKARSDFDRLCELIIRESDPSRREAKETDKMHNTRSSSRAGDKTSQSSALSTQLIEGFSSSVAERVKQAINTVKSSKSVRFASPHTRSQSPPPKSSKRVQARISVAKAASTLRSPRAGKIEKKELTKRIEATSKAKAASAAKKTNLSKIKRKNFRFTKKKKRVSEEKAVAGTYRGLGPRVNVATGKTIIVEFSESDSSDGDDADKKAIVARKKAAKKDASDSSSSDESDEEVSNKRKRSKIKVLSDSSESSIDKSLAKAQTKSAPRGRPKTHHPIKQKSVGKKRSKSSSTETVSDSEGKSDSKYGKRGTKKLRKSVRGAQSTKSQNKHRSTRKGVGRSNNTDTSSDSDSSSSSAAKPNSKKANKDKDGAQNKNQMDKSMAIPVQVSLSRLNLIPVIGEGNGEVQGCMIGEAADKLGKSEGQGMFLPAANLDDSMLEAMQSQTRTDPVVMGPVPVALTEVQLPPVPVSLTELQPPVLDLEVPDPLTAAEVSMEVEDSPAREDLKEEPMDSEDTKYYIVQNPEESPRASRPDDQDGGVIEISDSDDDADDSDASHESVVIEVFLRDSP